MRKHLEEDYQGWLNFFCLKRKEVSTRKSRKKHEGQKGIVNNELSALSLAKLTAHILPKLHQLQIILQKIDCQFVPQS